MKTFPLRIVTPEGPAFEGDVSIVVMRSTVGSFGVMANHSPMIVECPPGALRAQDGRDRTIIFDCGHSVFTMDGTTAVVLTAFAQATTLPREDQD